LNNFLRRLARPVGRGRLAWAVLFSVQSFAAVAWYKAPDPYAVYVFYLVIAVLWAPLWLIAVVGRLRDIGWNRWLALAYILPWIAFFWATSRMSVRACRHHRRHARRTEAAVRGWPHSAGTASFWALARLRRRMDRRLCRSRPIRLPRAPSPNRGRRPRRPGLLHRLGGALTPELAPGTAHNVAGVIDVRTGERFHCDAGAGSAGWSPAPRSPTRRKSSAWPPPTEPAWWIWRRRPSPAWRRCAASLFIASRESATATDKLPDFNRFISRMASFRLARLVFLRLLRPWYWPALIADGRE
jgi:adenosylhomocysteine nucleosidase